jgi:hypothetical protein
MELPVEEEFISKFPRTHHLFDMGSATRDDLVSDSKDVDLFLGDDVVLEVFIFAVLLTAIGKSRWRKPRDLYYNRLQSKKFPN